ncbi:MAG: hypothetical protein R3D84_15060 [Paracoccaceae bacterium]
MILPITDPYVVHHGALGSFATCYLPAGADRDAIMAKLAARDEIILVVTREEAVKRFDLPADRIGDLVSDLGRDHDHRHLGAPPRPRRAEGTLRSHGGLTEQEVPFIVNRTIDLPNAPELRNFDAFLYACTAAAL